MINTYDRSSQLYKGYLQEARTYLSYPFRHKRKATKRFVILSLHRSGSALLSSLLNAHPLIQCEGPLFYYRKLFPLKYIECRNRLSAKPVFGFKIMPNHIGYQGYNDPVRFMAELVNSSYSVLMLTRRNLFHIAISLVYAQMSGKYHYKYSERTQKLPKLSIEPVKVIEKIDWIKRLSELQKEIVKSLPHIEFVYEDHLLPATEHQATVDRIVDYLGIPRAPVTTNLSRTGTDRIIDSIANFKEIDEILRQRYASQYLAEINY